MRPHRTPELAPASATPLAETLARISPLEVAGTGLSVRLGPPEGPGWTTAAGLAGDDVLLEELLRRMGRVYDSEDRAVLGALFLRGYLWRILLPAVAAFLLDRRVPDVGAENVALRFDERGGATGLALLGGRFAALDGDPASGAAGVLVAAGEVEMLAWFRGRLAEAHLPALFSALERRGMRRARRALWGMVADLVAEAFAWTGPVLDLEPEARAFAEAALDGSPPISGAANFSVVEHEGGPLPTRVRNSCCLYYRVGGDTCLTCPRNTRDERMQRLTAG